VHVDPLSLRPYILIKVLGLLDLGHNALVSKQHRHMAQCRVVFLTWRVARPLGVPRQRFSNSESVGLVRRSCVLSFIRNVLLGTFAASRLGSPDHLGLSSTASLLGRMH
jgi:hypothetical protein